MLITVLSSCDSYVNPLVGKYDLHTIEAEDSMGIWQEANWMKGGKGRLQYFDNDTLSVHFNPKNYGDEGVEAYWYIANYKLNLDSSYAVHTRVKHSNPMEIGKSVKRYFRIKEDTLIMFAKEFGFRLKWIKRNE